jgi:hypothetical protein
MAEHAVLPRFLGLFMRVMRAVPLAALCALQGCAAVVTADGQSLALASPEFRAYVERVFREQNRVADALGFALEDSAAAPTELVAAEQALLTACAGVNELATARRDEQRLSLRRSARTARTVPQCEQAATSAAGALAVSGSEHGTP